MKKFIFILILLTLQFENKTLLTIQQPLLDQPLLEQHLSGQPTFSFDDFLKQLESEQTSPDQEDGIKPEQSSSKQFTQVPFPFITGKKDPTDKNKKLEQEIIDLLEKQIKPLANDLSKIIQGPEATKALEDKKKEREQKEKETEKRLEQMRRQRPSSYYPSYRSPSSSYGKDWTPNKYGRGDYGGRGYSDASGYSPRSYWDKYKDTYKDTNKLDTPEKKSGEQDKEKGGIYKSKKDKDLNKSLDHAINLTKGIKEILIRLINSGPNIKELATSGTFAELKDKFDKREDELSNISYQKENNEKQEEKKARHNTLNKELKHEKALWQTLLPSITRAITFTETTQDSNDMQEAQQAGRDLLRSLKNKDYVSEQSVNTLLSQLEKSLLDELKNLESKDTTKEDDISKILRQAAKIPGGPQNPDLKRRSEPFKTKDEKKESDEQKTNVQMNKFRNYTQIIKNLIEQNTEGLNPDSTDPEDIKKNEEIYKKLVTTSKLFTQILEWFNKRDEVLMELANRDELINEKNEQELWENFVPCILQAITYTDLDEDPTKTETVEMLAEQAQGKKFLEKLKLLRCISEETLTTIRENFEKDLAEKIKAVTENNPAGTRLKKIRDEKLPGGPRTDTLKNAKFKT